MTAMTATSPRSRSDRANAARGVPLLVDLAGRRCVVAGGGEVAARRALSLLDAGAIVSVVSPEVGPHLASAIREGRVAVWHPRDYESGDAKGCTLVVAATSDPGVNDAVGRDAVAHGALCNRADRPEAGDIVFSSVMRRGEIVIGVSTHGVSPTLAAVIRRDIEDLLGPEWEPFADLLGRYRDRLREVGASPEQRQAAIRRMVGDGVLQALADGRADQADAIVRRVLEGTA